MPMLSTHSDVQAETTVELEKTAHGWRIYHLGDDPETRFLSPSPETLRHLRRKAERKYRRAAWIRRAKRYFKPT